MNTPFTGPTALLAALVLTILGMGKMSTTAQQPIYRWKNVAIGGGGYITGIVIHPTEPNLVYARTDVGGFYRWDAANTRWIAITDHFTLAEYELYGGESIALDPQNPDVVYVACGRSLTFGKPSGVYKSANRGATWTRLPLNNVEMHGNGTKRNTGERLAVSPHDGNLILFGTRGDGLQRSANGGASWAKLTSFPDVWTWGTGFTAVVFDPLTAGVVYASAYGADADDGVRLSTNNGDTWTLLAGGPANVNRMAVTGSGALIVSHETGVSKYAAGTWTHYTPGGVAQSFVGLTVNPANAHEILVAEGATDTSRIYRSTDGGSSWTLVPRTKTSTVPWLDTFRRNNPRIAPLVFDPTAAGRVWFSDWYGVWRTEDINAATPMFTNYLHGLEEMVVFALAAPATGAPLLSGVADNDGFRHGNPDQFPASRYSGNQDTWGLAVFAGDPQKIVRASGGRGGPYHVLTSGNGGANWTTTNWNTAAPGVRALRVAVSATDANNIVALTDSSLAGGGGTWRTTDGGTNWDTVTGLPAGLPGPFYNGHPLVADPQLAGTFYFHERLTGKVYRSTDGGLNFIERNAASLLPVPSLHISIKANPAAEGDLWACVDTAGLYRSTDGGASFAAVPNVTRAYRCSFGKAPTGSGTPALYLYGKITGFTGWMFRSLDLGQTWTEIFDPAVAMGNEPAVFEASAQTYGLVFVGTAGRGIFYGQPLPAVSVTATVSAAELGSVAGSFTLSRNGDIAQALTVQFTLGGTATGGSDYIPPALTLTIPAGAVSAPVLIAPLPDNLAEGDETVTLALSPGSDYLPGTGGTLTLADKPYDTWRFANGLANAAPDADSDNDGTNDFLEYALGSDPTTPGPPTYPIRAWTAGQLTLTYQRLRPATEVEYRVEVSDNLTNWNHGAAFVNETMQPDGITVIARDLAPANASLRFIYLRVLRAP